jgi:hypothetical protein
MGVNPAVGVVLIGSGGFWASQLFIERWRSDHGYGPLGDWRPSRGAYLAPLALLCIGVLLIILVPGHTSRWIGVGIGLVACSVPVAAALAIRRAMLNTESN